MSEQKKSKPTFGTNAENFTDLRGDTQSAGHGQDGSSVEKNQHEGCAMIKPIPERLLAKAAEVASKINPINSPQLQMNAELAEAIVSDPQALTVLTTKYWGPIPRRLTVSFIEATPADLRRRILLHMNAWNRTAGISFVETGGVGNVRISRGAGGYWSYLGTDIMLIPPTRPTMNLQGFTMATPESEYRRVVRHETGHTMGFPHEHLRRELISRINPAKAYEYFKTRYGWTKEMVDRNVLTPLDANSILGTPPDQTSIMCYQLPGTITYDGRPILGGADINATDYSFAGRIYPKFWFLGGGAGSSSAEPEDWPESEDVSENDLEEAIRQLTSKSEEIEIAG